MSGLKTKTVYDLVSGKTILILSSPSPETDDWLQQGYGVVDGAWPDLAYYVHPQTQIPTPRPLLELTVDKTRVVCNGSDVATVSGLPIPCLTKINGEEIWVDDGSLELTFELAGVYRIELDPPWPYRPATVEIIANED